MRKNKDATVIPPLSSNTPLDDTTIPLDDYFETNHEVHVPSPLTSETATLNPHNDEQGSRYSLRDRKEPDRRNEGSSEELFLGDGRAPLGKENSGMLSYSMKEYDSNSTKIEKLWSYLAKEFEMKGLGALKYFLDTSIEINHGLSIYLVQIPTNKERY
ncbi:hypothetical protein CK203_046897 [Vitis vinifera]|uniref:Reverse transcriptase Ty1/copia-type domain-containing protein n=1 Tax=Vitis vinifera TaxID=29760 RepID=A0A438HE27_VITVI|nr:hypothetical protein CK203_046897 [Vitis vinifera]